LLVATAEVQQGQASGLLLLAALLVQEQLALA
jgi:hypothetical protein